MLKTLAAILGLVAPYFVQVHDGYEGLTNRNLIGSSFSCCGNHDCYPTQAYMKPDGSWMALVLDNGNEMWMPVPQQAILPDELNPKAGPSVCWNQMMHMIRCFMPGRST